MIQLVVGGRCRAILLHMSSPQVIFLTATEPLGVLDRSTCLPGTRTHIRVIFDLRKDGSGLRSCKILFNSGYYTLSPQHV